MRGLKRLMRLATRLLLLVASFTDAWIETEHTHTKDVDNQSHLLQMRGLKLFVGLFAISF